MKRRLPFAKLHGLGNDFIVLEESALGRARPGPLAKSICDRNTGVGADGICVIAKLGPLRFKMRIFNSDGSEAEMSGNGIRCVGRYIWARRLSSGIELNIDTLAGVKSLRRQGATIWVDMGPPLDTVHAVSIEVDDRRFDGHSTLALGNPQVVFFRFDERTVDALDIRRWGPLIENHPRFPNRTNVEFAEPLSESRVKVKIWERGAGETKASGTGACAVAYIGHTLGILGPRVEEELPGGKAKVVIEKDRILLGGPAVYICDGHWRPSSK